MQTTTRAALAAIPVALVFAACGADSGDASAEDRELVVLAAASLTDVYADLADDFAAENDGVEVTFSFGSSTDLAEQVADGAPGDVLATASGSAMDIAEEAGVTTEIENFASNLLTIITPPDNPAGIESLSDLEGTTWVRCADEVPCGAVALSVIEANQIADDPASLEEDVRAALDKVISGEAEAGLVYTTDAVVAGDGVETIEIPGAEEQLTSYFISGLTQSEDPELAQGWVDFISSEEAQAKLQDAGFAAP